MVTTETRVLQNQLYELRKDRHVSQVHLAKECGFSLYRLGNIERGEKVPSLVEALTIAEFFDKEISYVFTISRSK